MKRLSKVWKLLVLGTGIALLLSCSGGDVGGDGPGQAVRQFYDALNTGDYGSARGLYSTEALAVIDDPSFSSEGAFRDWAEGETKQGSISDVRIVGSEVDESGSVARVEFEINYGDGSKKASAVTVVQEGGAWRLGLIG